jgi:carboxylesterase type B
MVTTPNAPVDSNLPVVVWIHGGGNIAGTPYRGVYDAKNWVKRGIVQGSPFIFVSLSFRVHLFGWLPWEGQGNWSLHDQRLGLEWVHKHIKEFGGNPNKVTLVGQSSGSCDAFMQSVHPAATDYFRQAAYLSGSYRSIQPRGADEYTALAKSIAKHAGTSVKGLRDCPWQKLVEATSAVGVEVLHPVDDGIFLPVGTYGSPPTSMESIIISDAKEDAYFWSQYLSNDILKSTVCHPQFKSLFHAYGITAASDLGTVRRSVLEFLTDVVFSVPNHEADKKCRVAGVNVFRQLFDVTNPFTPSLGNNHMVDVIYLFNAYDIPSPKDHAVTDIQDRWVKFFNFKEPWEANKALLVSDSYVKPIAIEDISKHRRLSLINALDDCLLALHKSLGLEGWPPQ